MSKRVTFLVPIHRAEELCPEALTSLNVQSLGEQEVVVLGIGCGSEPPEALTKVLPKVAYLPVPPGTRSAEALNRGLHMCETPLVAVVDPGLKLDPQWLEMVFEAFASDLSIFMVTGKVLGSRAGRRLEGIAEGVDDCGERFTLGVLEEDADHWDIPRDVFGPYPSAAVFRRKLFSLIGPFDGAYGGGAEMADLAFRARWQAFKTKYVPEARSYRIPGTEPRSPASRAVQNDKLRLFFKCMPEPLIWLNAPRVLCTPLTSWNPLELARGSLRIFSFLRGLPGLLSRRREVMSGARVDLYYIYRRLVMAPPGSFLCGLYRSVMERLLGPHGPTSKRPAPPCVEELPAPEEPPGDLTLEPMPPLLLEDGPGNAPAPVPPAGLTSPAGSPAPPALSPEALKPGGPLLRTGPPGPPVEGGAGAAPVSSPDRVDGKPLP